MLRVCSKRRHCEADSAYAIFLPTGWGVPKIQLAQKRENLSQATLKLGARGVARNSESDETYLVRKSRCLKTMQYKFRPPSEPIKDIVFFKVTTGSGETFGTPLWKIDGLCPVQRLVRKYMILDPKYVILFPTVPKTPN